MKVYLAARYSRHDEMEKHKKAIEKKLGWQVVSRWHSGDHKIDDDQAAFEQNRRFAHEDMDDLKEANIVLHFTEHPKTTTSRGGRHVELGMAIAFCKINHVIGPRENIFHYLNSVCHWDNFDSYINHVLKLRG